MCCCVWTHRVIPGKISNIWDVTRGKWAQELRLSWIKGNKCSRFLGPDVSHALLWCNTDTVSHCCSFPSRSPWRDDLCSFNPRHGHLRSSDDVFNHPPHRLLHRLDLWWRHHARVVPHEYTVRPAMFACWCLSMSECFKSVFQHCLFQGGCGLWSGHHRKWWDSHENL